MKESRLGKSVANLKKNRDYRVIDLATNLLEKWRKILTDERRAKQADEGLGMVKKKGGVVSYSLSLSVKLCVHESRSSKMDTD